MTVWRGTGHRFDVVRPPGGGHDGYRRGAVRVVLADDSRLLRESFASALSQVGIDVVAQAGDADELARAVNDTVPDVAVTDVRMPPTHTDEGVRAHNARSRRHPRVLAVLRYLGE